MAYLDKSPFGERNTVVVAKKQERGWYDSLQLGKKKFNGKWVNPKKNKRR